MSYGDHNHSISPSDYLYGGTPVHVDRNVPPDTMYRLTDGIYMHPQKFREIQQTMPPVTFQPGWPTAYTKPYTDPDILRHLGQLNTNTTKKEPEVSTIEKIKAERREKREREELDAKFQAWDEVIGSPNEGDVVTFTVDLSNKTYRYAALYVDKRWFLTGATTCGMAPEDFIAWLIERDVDLGDMILMEPLT